MANQEAIPHLDSIHNTAVDFGIGEWTIRQWVKQERFPVIPSGKKILINYDIFRAFLNCDLNVCNAAH